MQMDANGDGVISRAEFKSFMQQARVADGIAEQLQMVAQMSGQMPELFAQIKEIRNQYAEQFGGFFQKLFAKAAGWAKGGVDEVTFLATVVPIYKEQLAKGAKIEKINESIQKMQQSMNQMNGGASNPLVQQQQA